MKELAIINEQLAIVASETLGGALAPGGRRPRRPQASSPANGTKTRQKRMQSRKRLWVADEVRKRIFNHKEHIEHKEHKKWKAVTE